MNVLLHKDLNFKRFVPKILKEKIIYAQVCNMWKVTRAPRALDYIFAKQQLVGQQFSD
jgi:hypothetical protein